jgi:hypothetical protein
MTHLEVKAAHLVNKFETKPYRSNFPSIFYVIFKTTTIKKRVTTVWRVLGLQMENMASRGKE